jgi:hypothetical protein
LKLERIYAYGATCDGASHLSSAVDVVLGSLRYCVNTDKDAGWVTSMFQQVSRLMWHSVEGDVPYVREYGLILRPNDVWHPVYLAVRRSRRALHVNGGRDTGLTRCVS